jgi:hypothetical protein
VPQPPFLTCSPTTLTLHVHLDELPETVQHALRTWFQAHRLNPDDIAIGLPIERDPSHARLTWRVASRRSVENRTRASDEPDSPWPPPFPAEVLHSREARTP